MFKGIVCEVSGERCSPEECLACARSLINGCQHTAPMLAYYLTDRRPDNFGMTVTTLQSCPRKVQLKQLVDYWEKPETLWALARGTSLHASFAAAAKALDPTVVVEKRFSLPVFCGDDIVMVSGEPDLFYPEQGHLVDYKTTISAPRPRVVYVCLETGEIVLEGASRSKKPFACTSCGGNHRLDEARREMAAEARPKNVQQVQLYAFILQQNGYYVRTAELVYMDMKGSTRISVPLLTEEEAWAVLEDLVQKHHQETINDLAPVLTDRNDTWECNYCPVQGACEEAQQKAFEESELASEIF